jgi:hypothetical protein
MNIGMYRFPKIPLQKYLGNVLEKITFWTSFVIRFLSLKILVYEKRTNSDCPGFIVSRFWARMIGRGKDCLT